MVYNFFDKKSSGSCIKNENVSNKQLSGELQKPIMRKCNKRKVHSSFMAKFQVQIYNYSQNMLN